MIDPLADVVGLLRPGVRYTKIVGAAGRWGVRRTETGEPSYCVVLDGTCLLTAADMNPIALEPGDFVLIPATYDFSMSSLRPPPARDFDKPPAQVAPGEVRHGTRDGPPDVRFLIGHCEFAAPDAALLVSLLPRVVHVRGEARLATLVQLVNDEARAGRPARDVVLARLLEVLLIEALRGPAARTRRRGSCAVSRTHASRTRCARCTRRRNARGRWPISRGKRPCRAPRSSSVSAAPWAWRRWPTC
jgi:hypothetical protein